MDGPGVAVRGKSVAGGLAARWIALAVVSSAAAFYLSTGFGTAWPLVWVAPIPVLWVVLRTSRRVGFLAAFLAFLGGSLNMLTFFLSLAPPAAVAAVLLILALAFGLCALTARISTVAFAAAWTTFEFLWSFGRDGVGFSLANTQVKLLPVVQLASITGIWGIAFLLMLVPAAAASAWHRRSWRRVIPTALVLAAVFGYGVWRLSWAPFGPPVKVGLEASDRTVRFFRTENETDAVHVADDHAARAARLAAQGAGVVVMPEKFVGVTPEDRDRVVKIFSDTARANRILLVAGLNQVDLKQPSGLPERNTAFVFAPDGSLILAYDKHHLLPGPESREQPGNTLGIFHHQGQTWGVAICKDMDFPAWSRRYGQLGARLMLVPAWDFGRDQWVHGRIAILRAVENGFAMVRTAQDGLLMAIDDRGRIVASTSTLDRPDATLVAQVTPGYGSTFYTQTGDWFPWVCMLLLLLSIAARRQSRFRLP